MDRVERSHDEGNPDTAPASQVLNAVRAKTRGDKVAVGDVLDGASARVYGLALMLFALPEALPLPIIGLTAVVAIPLAIVSVWLVLFGTGASCRAGYGAGRSGAPGWRPVFRRRQDGWNGWESFPVRECRDGRIAGGCPASSACC